MSAIGDGGPAGAGEEREVESLTIGEARAIMVAAAGRRNAVRWGVALGSGRRSCPTPCSALKAV